MFRLGWFEPIQLHVLITTEVCVRAMINDFQFSGFKFASNARTSACPLLAGCLHLPLFLRHVH